VLSPKPETRNQKPETKESSLSLSRVLSKPSALLNTNLFTQTSAHKSLNTNLLLNLQVLEEGMEALNRARFQLLLKEISVSTDWQERWASPSVSPSPIPCSIRPYLSSQNPYLSSLKPNPSTLILKPKIILPNPLSLIPNP
jgi:hypothetical protein